MRGENQVLFFHGWVQESIKKLLKIPPTTRILILISGDAFILISATYAAMFLRTGHIFEGWWDIRFAVLVSIALGISIFWSCGLYREVLRFNSRGLIRASCIAVGCYALVFFVAFAVVGKTGVPRTVGVLQPLLVFLEVLGFRLFLGWTAGVIYSPSGTVNVLKTAWVGSKSTSIPNLAGSHGLKHFEIVVYVDTDESIHGRRRNGRTIIGPEELERFVPRLGLSLVLLSSEGLTLQLQNQIRKAVSKFSVDVKVVPSTAELLRGHLWSDLSSGVNFERILERIDVAPMPELLEQKIVDRSVLITGAGGSIGMEITKQLLALRPKILILLEASEFSLYEVCRRLKPAQEQTSVRIVPLIGSVKDSIRINLIFDTFKPDVVFHAAAYKHVPIMEANLIEALTNNTFGTETLALTAIKHEVEDFVMVSSDKAVRPSNIMGASKRLAELVLQALNDEYPSGPRFSMVRFGNVLESSGSVIPLFRSQIERGGPITVTHEEVTRYFMTIPEAAQLVIQSTALARGGDIFLLDMGESVKVADLARRMIRIYGLTEWSEENPEGDIEIIYTGLRPGEKLYEELLLSDKPMATVHPKIMRGEETFLTWPDLLERLDAIKRSLGDNDLTAVVNIVNDLVEGFTPSSDLGDIGFHYASDDHWSRCVKSKDHSDFNF